MKLNRSVVIALALGLAASGAQAQNYQSQIRLTGVGSTVAHGYYVGPYTGATPGMPSLDIYCVDFLNGVSIGNAWTANFTSIGSLLDDATNLGRTRWGQVWGGGAISMYQRAAWLASFFAVSGTSQWGGIHGAIWDIFTPTNNPGWTDRLPWMNAASAAATAEYAFGPGDYNWDNWYVVTDVQTSGITGGRQEYLTYITPEPETLLLLGTGLVGVLGVALAAKRFG
jgi:hypothetical protein